jgi:hypothetical protein
VVEYTYKQTKTKQKTLEEDKEMESLKIGTQVKGYSSRCIGTIIEANIYYGEIIKINKKSIKVHVVENVNTYGKKEVSRFNRNEEVTYKFWKTTSDGKNIYKSDLCGTITF